jgi:hypothetical protein
MIAGFEEQTEPLSEYETSQLLPLITSGLKSKQGAASAITNKAICTALRSRGLKISEARVRKIINHIRKHDLIPCLIATSKGYYITHDRAELETYIQSLKSREDAIRQVRHSMQGWLSQQMQLM